MVVRAADLPPPRRASDEDFDAICATFKIDRSERGGLRRRLDEIADEFAANIRGERLRPDPQADFARLHRILKAIRKARLELAAPMGGAAERGLRTAAPSLQSMVTAGWFLAQLPREDEMPRIMSETSDTQHEAEREMRPRIIGFARERPVDFLSAILADVEMTLLVGARLVVLLPGARGGRKPLTQRKYLLANLATCWDAVGRQPTSGPNSQFTAFCEAVFEAIGWPTTGVEAAVPDALSVWRNRTKKIAG
jgi:hypothetical protein